MNLPIRPPIEPMLAKSAAKVPRGDFVYEPKWDGFRGVVFRDGDDVELASRGGKTLTRYFPELVESLREALPERCVVDGEIVVVRDGRLEWEVLAERIHPAESRVKLLAETTPASFIAFDLLALGDELLTETGFAHRRERLLGVVGAHPNVHVTATTTDAGVADEWFELFEGAGLDGVVAKPSDGPYLPGERVMVKVKHERTADMVVAGYRHHKSGPIVGSLMLGLYDEAGLLQYVGGAAAFTMTRRAELIDELAPYLVAEDGEHPWLGEPVPAGQRRPGEPNRWNSTKDRSFFPLRPELVCEIRYDQMQGDRLRHAGRFVRWRPDREPASCAYDQLDVPASYDLADVLAARS